jgi:hypothetical protein
MQGHGFRPTPNVGCGLRRYFDLLHHQPFVGLGKPTGVWDRGRQVGEDLTHVVIPYSTSKYRKEFIVSDKMCYRATLCKPELQNCREPKVGFESVLE